MILWSTILLLTASNVLTEINFNVCQVGHSGKCLGNPMTTLDIGTPMFDAHLLSSKDQMDYDSCSYLCTWDPLCHMAAFNIDTYNCQLFRRISFKHSTSPVIKLFLWSCCNHDISTPAINRCPGIWTMQSQSISDNKIRSGDPLVEFKANTYYECLIQCFNNGICGAVNYLNLDYVNGDVFNCQLIIQFPVEKMVYVPAKNWRTFRWRCAVNYSMPRPSNECLPRIGHPIGYWVVRNTSLFNTNSTQSLLYFYTLDSRQCTHNCALHVNCEAAWYSEASYLCVLETSKEDRCADTTPESNDTYTVYKWTSCPGYTVEIKQENQTKSSCRTLVDNRYTYIYPIKCGQLPNKPSSIYKCWEEPVANRGTVYSPNLRCQVNQTFRVFDSLPKSTASMFTTLENVTWLRVYTGYQTFWLINVSSNNFPATHSSRCDIFNSSPENHDEEPLQIVKRTEWFPNKSKRPENPYSKKPVKYVVISDTEVPFCSCFSFEACSSVMRRIQLALQTSFVSIPYSFVIGGDGVVYEGRGFDRETAAVDVYNSNSLVIALCGQYKTTPPIKPLMALKKLIKLAVQVKKVRGDYVLYIYNDIRDRLFPYEGLRRVIELWPHYRGNIEQDCRPINNVTIIVDIFVMVFSVVLVIICVQVFVRRIWHAPLCTMVRRCRIETLYGNIFDKSSEVLPQILLHPISFLRVEENYISPFTAPVIWIEDLKAIFGRNKISAECHCREAIFASLDCRRLQSRLLNIGTLTHLPEVISCSKITVFVFERHGDMGREHVLILHLDNVKSFQRFINHLHRNKCVCDYFHLIKYHTLSNEHLTEATGDWDERFLLAAKRTGTFRDAIQEKYTFSFQPNKYRSQYIYK